MIVWVQTPVAFVARQVLWCWGVGGEADFRVRQICGGAAFVVGQLLWRGSFCGEGASPLTTSKCCHEVFGGCPLLWERACSRWHSLRTVARGFTPVGLRSSPQICNLIPSGISPLAGLWLRTVARGFTPVGLRSSPQICNLIPSGISPVAGLWLRNVARGFTPVGLQSSPKSAIPFLQA